MSQRRSLQAADLFRLRLLSDVQLAPDGRRIAYVQKWMSEETNDYLSNVYTVDRDGHASQFTSGGKDWGPRWSPDGRCLAFVSDRKDRSQIHLLPTSGGESQAVTELPLGAGLPLWSPDSAALVFVAPVSMDGEESVPKKGEEKPAKTKIVQRASYKLDGAGYIGDRRRHLFRLDLESRVPVQLTEGDWHDDNPCWSPDGQVIAFSSGRTASWDTAPQSDIWVMPRQGGEARRVLAGGAYGRPTFSPDGTRLAFVGHRDLDDVFALARIYSVRGDGSDLRDELGSWDGALGCHLVSDVVFSAEEHAVTLQWSEDGIYFLGTERGECNVYRAQEGTVCAITRGSHTITDFSVESEGRLAVTRADATHLAEVYLWSGAEGRQLTRENDSLLSEVYIATPERIQYSGDNGEWGESWLLAPPDYQDGQQPLIVYIHGGPMLAHGEGFHFEYQFLAGQGFGVFYPNIHGSSSYGNEYQTSIRNDWGNLDFRDVLTGVDEALQRPWTDATRLGIAGGSYGGFMVNWVITHTERFRAAVSERCLCNMVSFMGTSDSGWLWDRQFGGFPETTFQKLWAMSPIAHVEQARTPVLVMHSERDDRTPVEQGEQMFNALRRLGVETKFVIFPEESHGLSRTGKPSRRVERLGYIVDWFRTHL